MWGSLCQAHGAQEPVHGSPVTLLGPQQGHVRFSTTESLLPSRDQAGARGQADRQPVCLRVVHRHLQSLPLKIPPSTQPRPGLPRDGELALKTPFVSSWTRLGTLEDRVKPST